MNQEQIVSNLLITDQLKSIVSRASGFLETIRAFEKKLNLEGSKSNAKVTSIMPRLMRRENENPDLIKSLTLMSKLQEDRGFKDDVEYLYWFRNIINEALDNLNVFIEGLEQKYIKLDEKQLREVSLPLKELKIAMHDIVMATS